MKPPGARYRLISMSAPPVSAARLRNTIRSPVSGWTSGLSSVPIPDPAGRGDFRGAVGRGGVETAMGSSSEAGMVPGLPGPEGSGTRPLNRAAQPDHSSQSAVIWMVPESVADG